MKKTVQLLTLLVAGWINTLEAQGATNSAASDRVLVIDPSSMPVAGGKAILTIGALHRTNGVYAGDYKIKVTPYFFKSEKGRLATLVSDESLAKIARDQTEAVIGTATTNGKGGQSRHIDATVRPVDLNHGTIKLWFAAGDRKMIFEPAYHFADKRTATLVAQTTPNNTTAKLP